MFFFSPCPAPRPPSSPLNAHNARRTRRRRLSRVTLCVTLLTTPRSCSLEAHLCCIRSVSVLRVGGLSPRSVLWVRCFTWQLQYGRFRERPRLFMLLIVSVLVFYGGNLRRCRRHPPLYWCSRHVLRQRYIRVARFGKNKSGFFALLSQETIHYR